LVVGRQVVSYVGVVIDMPVKGGISLLRYAPLQTHFGLT